MEGKPRESARGCRCPCTWGVTVLMVWVLGCRFHFIHPLGLPSIAAGASAIRLVHLAAAAPRLAVLGRPSAPWPGVPAPRVPQVLVLTPCRARGLCWPPRVPAPATHLGVRRPPPGLGPPRVVGDCSADARCGKCVFSQRSPRVFMLPRPSARQEGRPGRVYPAMSFIREARRRGWGGCFLGCPGSWVGCVDDHCFVFRDNAFWCVPGALGLVVVSLVVLLRCGSSCAASPLWFTVCVSSWLTTGSFA